MKKYPQVNLNIGTDHEKELCHAIYALIRAYEKECLCRRIKAGIQRKKIQNLSLMK